MNFRRQPFQFTSIDPVKRHAELQKRFGLPSDEMFVDCVNPGVVGAGEKESFINSSPRLQHRVPIFSQDVHSTKSSGIHNNVDNGHQPRVRVIPIQVEGVNDTSRRQRTFSGPVGTVKSDMKEKSLDQRFGHQHKLFDSANKKADEPRVCNIPVKVELNNKGQEKESTCKETVIPTVIQRKEQPPEESSNGCTVSKTLASGASNSLKQIEDVLKKFKGYQNEVEKFTGTTKDKQYRYLDEMLTRCMLDLDNVDTLGINNVRQSRKDAVKQVQACIDLLETKVTTRSTVAESVHLGKVDPTNSDGTISQLDVQKNAMAADTEMKKCDDEHKNLDVEMEKGNSINDCVNSSQLTKACDIEMEDKSFEDQSSNLVVEELEDLDRNLVEVKATDISLEDTSSENQSLEFIGKMSEDKECSTNDERMTVNDVEGNSEGVTSELVIEEMCCDLETSPDQEITVASELNVEPVVTEHDSCELLQLSDNLSNEQIPTSSSNKSDLNNSSMNTNKDMEEISITEIPNTIDTIAEE